MTPRLPLDTEAVRSALRSDTLRRVLSNSSARVLALVGLAVATVVVARIGGPSAVGSYALLRMLPGLVGVLCVAGLPGAMAYYLAEPRRSLPRLWPTVFALLGAGAVLGTLVWFVAAPLVASTFFPEETTLLIAAAGITVATQLLLTLGKTALQGLEDRRGADTVIAAEELSFLPFYLVALALGMSGTAAIIIGLALADVAVAADAWRRVRRQLGGSRREHPVHRRWAPDLALARSVVSYGLRGQVGGFMTLLNLRLDFVILGAMAGPAVLGTYAVASKYAELLKLPGTALTWVSYPRLAGLGERAAALHARRLLRPAVVGIVLAAVPMMLLAAPVTNLLYGSAFDSAVRPAQVLLVGMLLGGAAGVASGYLYGRGRPGLNSLVMGLGLVVTVVLDLLLIPRYGALGAAVASTTAYLVTDALLVGLLLRLSAAGLRTSTVLPHGTRVEAST